MIADDPPSPGEARQGGAVSEPGARRAEGGAGRPDTALRVADWGIDTGPEHVACLHEESLSALGTGRRRPARIWIEAEPGETTGPEGEEGGPPRPGSRPPGTGARLEVAVGGHEPRPGIIALGRSAYRALGLPPGARVRARPAIPGPAHSALTGKLQGERLAPEALKAIVDGIVRGELGQVEIAAFLVAVRCLGLDADEVTALTQAMVATGERLRWPAAMVVDKHCIGGVPGNRTSLVVVPIVAAHGLLIPKTSSRAITSAAGTADCMETLAEVALPLERMRAVVERHGGCIAWGGRAQLSPVDDRLIGVGRPLRLDAPGQMVASILSKKLAVGSTHALIDIPVGGKVASPREAFELARLFERVAHGAGLVLETELTDGSAPVGRGIGPALEARDAMRVLRGHPEAPPDLRERALVLAGRILELDPTLRGGEGRARAQALLDSGRALEKMAAIIDAQGRREPPVEPGACRAEVSAPAPGRVAGFENDLLVQIARSAGAPECAGAGVYLHCARGGRVEAGAPLYEIRAERPELLQAALVLARSRSAVRVEAD